MKNEIQLELVVLRATRRTTKRTLQESVLLVFQEYTEESGMRGRKAIQLSHGHLSPVMKQHVMSWLECALVGLTLPPLRGAESA